MWCKQYPNCAFLQYMGTSLANVPAPPAPQMGYAPPPAQQYYPYQYPASYWEVVRTSKINNTLTGLLLLVIGVLIAWIPFAGFIGGLVGFIGESSSWSIANLSVRTTSATLH